MPCFGLNGLDCHDCQYIGLICPPSLPQLMEIVLKWMNGCKFADLGISEDLFEGSVVRAIRRLEELLRQLACATKSIGEQDLERRFVQCLPKMRRGIIFSASLYL